MAVLYPTDMSRITALVLLHIQGNLHCKHSEFPTWDIILDWRSEDKAYFMCFQRWMLDPASSIIFFLSRKQALNKKKPVNTETMYYSVEFFLQCRKLSRWIQRALSQLSCQIAVLLAMQPWIATFLALNWIRVCYFLIGSCPISGLIYSECYWNKSSVEVRGLIYPFFKDLFENLFFVVGQLWAS